MEINKETFADTVNVGGYCISIVVPQYDQHLRLSNGGSKAWIDMFK
jgi:hypothetical protein